MGPLIKTLSLIHLALPSCSSHLLAGSNSSSQDRLLPRRTRCNTSQELTLPLARQARPHHLILPNLHGSIILGKQFVVRRDRDNHCPEECHEVRGKADPIYFRLMLIQGALHLLGEIAVCSHGDDTNGGTGELADVECSLLLTHDEWVRGEEDCRDVRIGDAEGTAWNIGLSVIGIYERFHLKRGVLRTRDKAGARDADYLGGTDR